MEKHQQNENSGLSSEEQQLNQLYYLLFRLLGVEELTMLPTILRNFRVAMARCFVVSDEQYSEYVRSIQGIQDLFSAEGADFRKIISQLSEVIAKLQDGINTTQESTEKMQEKVSPTMVELIEKKRKQYFSLFEKSVPSALLEPLLPVEVAPSKKDAHSDQAYQAFLR